MRFIVALVVAVAFVPVLAQEAPSLTPEEQLIVQVMLALQKSALAECEAVPQVKQLRDLMAKTNAQFRAKGKAIDWRTGALLPPK